MKWEDFKKRESTQSDTEVYHGYEHLSITDIECPNCGERIYKNNTFVLTTYPPQYIYECLYCNWTGVARS